MGRTLTVRAHHLLCLQGFQGYGYDDDFVAGMRRFLASVASQPELEFCVTTGVDAICQACPHRDGEVCRKDFDADRRIRAIDERVLAQLGIAVGHRALARELIALVNERIKTVGEADGICGDCPWTAECLWHQSLKK